MLNINMGRKKVEDEKKKVKLAVSLDPELPQYFKDKSINSFAQSFLFSFDSLIN